MQEWFAFLKFMGKGERAFSFSTGFSFLQQICSAQPAISSRLTKKGYLGRSTTDLLDSGLAPRKLSSTS